eukprot:tig00021244_g19578.t1
MAEEGGDGPHPPGATPVADADDGDAADAEAVQLHLAPAYSAHGHAVLESLLPTEKDLSEHRPVQTREAGKRITVVSERDGLERGVHLEELQAAVRGRSREDPRWLDFEAPTHEDMQVVERLFGLHPVTTEDCIQGDTTDKIEYFDKYIFITFTTLEAAGTQRLPRPGEQPPRPGSALLRWGSNLVRGEEDGEDAPVNFAMVLFRDLLLTFHYAPVPASPPSAPPRPRPAPPRAEGPAQVVERLRRSRRPVARGGLPPVHWVAYALLDAVVDQLAALVEDVAAEVAALDDLVVTLGEGDESELLKRIGVARRRAARLRRLLLRKREALRSLAEHAPEIAERVPAGTLVYLRDVADHVTSALQKLAAARETLAAMQANYHAKLSVDIARASARMNRILKLSSLVGTLFLWHTFVTGVFAMNINIPLQTKGDGSDTLGPFFGIVAEIALSTLAGLAAFRYMGWM